MKPIPKITAGALAAVLLSASAVFGDEAEIGISGWRQIRMPEPKGVMGLTWNGVKGNLPPVFLLSESGGGEAEKLGQLLTTAKTIGRLYVAKYDKAAGANEDGADMFKVESFVGDAKSGKLGEEARLTVERGEAVMFWSSMLEDYANALMKKGIAIRTDSTPPSSPQFMDCYVSQVLKGEDPDIYSYVIRQAAQGDKEAFDSYLAGKSKEEAETIKRIAAGTYSKQPPQ